LSRAKFYTDVNIVKFFNIHNSSLIVAIKKLGTPLELAKEEQITIYVGNVPYHIMCTPENLKELAVGFLISEGIAKSIDDIVFPEVPCLRNNRRIIMIEVNGDSCQAAIRSSGCIGIYRENEEIPGVEAGEKFTLNEIKAALHHLEIEEYHRTRGYHIAALVGKEGLLIRRYDVGRHNAVDKVIGAALIKRMDLSKMFLLLSGRISRGIAMKCARVGIPLVVSKAAILDSAVEVCRKSGLAAISFATNIAIVGKALEGI
jgi:FdhD protein